MPIFQKLLDMLKLQGTRDTESGITNEEIKRDAEVLSKQSSAISHPRNSSSALQHMPGFSQLRGGDQVHGIGNLEGLLYAVNAGADLLYSCHDTLTCFLYASSAPRICSVTAPGSVPVDWISSTRPPCSA